MQVHQADACRLGDWWHYEQVISPFWRLYCNDANGARLVLVDRSLPLVAGRLYLIPAWCRFGTACDGRPWHRYIHFDAGLPAPALRRLLPEPLLLVDDGLTADLWRSWCAAPASTADWHLQACCRLAVAEAVEGLPAAAQADLHRPISARLRPAWQLLHADDLPPLDVAALARRCQLSPDHFSRRFRQEVGQTPARYLRERRVTLVAERLLTSDKSIDAIATATGFANRYHLSRCFKDVIGCGPAHYRKLHMQH